jgi:hypothetical protein
MPPGATVVKLTLPPEDTTSAPLLFTVVLMALPPEDTY